MCRVPGGRTAVQNLKQSSTAVQLLIGGMTAVKNLKHNCSQDPEAECSHPPAPEFKVGLQKQM